MVVSRKKILSERLCHGDMPFLAMPPVVSVATIKVNLDNIIILIATPSKFYGEKIPFLFVIDMRDDMIGELVHHHNIQTHRDHFVRLDGGVVVVLATKQLFIYLP